MLPINQTIYQSIFLNLKRKFYIFLLKIPLPCRIKHIWGGVH